MDEWVIVDYPHRRRVNVDGLVNGVTRSIIQLSTGHHTFDLDTPVDYTPESQDVAVSGTTIDMPLHVTFTPLEVAVAAVTPPPAAKKRKKKKKNKRRARKTRKRR